MIEVAALELINDLPTGQYFHSLIDPERDVPDESTRIHGFTAAHLAGKPKFSEIAEGMLAFFQDGPLIAHNAPFDFRFIDAELARVGRQALPQNRMVDTLAMAKQRFPGMPNSLDALCRRFSIDLSGRSTHNALLDCKLLAEVYVELTGGRQRGFSLAREAARAPLVVYEHNGPRAPRPIVLTADELSAHQALIARIKEPLWLAP